jgi:hypothetical protein
MPWLNNLISAVKGNKVDVDDVKRRVQAKVNKQPITDEELEAYVSDIKTRVGKMVKDLKTIYAKFGIQFTGFKSLDLACTSLKDGLKSNKDEIYNNLIKLESSITAEQKRHVALIKMAVTKDSKKVIDQIMQDARSKEKFNEIFGKHDSATATANMDGTYQQLWSEIHRLSEYLITKKTKVYH